MDLSLNNPKIDTNKLFLPSFNHKIDRKLFMDIYTDIYNACTKNSQHGKIVYDALTVFLKAKMIETQKQWHRNGPTPILIQYLDFFQNYKISAKFYHHTMDYLNRHWIKRELDEGKSISDINTTCLIIFKDCLFESVKSDLLNEVKLLLFQFRQSNIQHVYSQLTSTTVPINASSSIIQLQSQLNDLVSSILLFCLDDQNYYHDQFIEPFKSWMVQYSEYYDGILCDYIESSSVKPNIITPNEQSCTVIIQYMTHAQSILNWEYQLLLNCFNHLFIDTLKSQLHELIINRFKHLIIMHLPIFLVKLNRNGLSLGYHLLNIVDTKAELFELVYTHVHDHLLEHQWSDDAPTSGSNNAINSGVVNHYMAIYTHFITLMECFNNDPGCIASLDRAFTDCLNNIPNIPELLAKQADLILKSKHQDVKQELQHVLILFKYINDKDIFHKVYSKGLCKRLLFNTSINEQEQWMVSQLKEYCGYEYTSKLQRLYSDIEVSRNLYSELIPSSVDIFNVSLSVISTATWPLVIPKETILLPAELEACCNRINEAYSNKHVGRKLTFMQTHGKCEMQYHRDKSYILTCSVFQSALLMLYNNRESYTLQELMTLLGLPMDTLIQHMGILMRAKITKGIVITTDQLSDALEKCTPETVVSINMEFSSKKLRINLFQFLKQSAQAEDEVINMDQDRQLVIQACLVRIMKSRKSLKYVVVMNEVIQQLSNKFKPKIGMIKKCIDVLIEKEYLKRDEADTNTLVYLA
eukprot:NODE_205_length_14851_cov_0.317584.p2 type:complete len:752 gc:universal NODE_205_length_14851_cov_0.317584:5373-7628(+)